MTGEQSARRSGRRGRRRITRIRPFAPVTKAAPGHRQYAAKSKPPLPLETANGVVQTFPNGYTRPSVDNLFSACELVSKAHLILHHSTASKAKSHGSIKSAINARRNIGNINDDFVRLFNCVSNTRSPARYDEKAEVEMPSPSDFQVVQSEIGQLMNLVKLRTISDQ